MNDFLNVELRNDTLKMFNKPLEEIWMAMENAPDMALLETLCY